MNILLLYELFFVLILKSSDVLALTESFLNVGPSLVENPKYFSE
jgi:hypothetical protein